MPWTIEQPPAVAQNWTAAERERCVTAANAVLERGGTDEEAIFACIAAAGKEQTMEREIKTFRARVTVKADDEKGTFTAAFATLNVIDHNNDVTLPGAFGEQRVLIEPWNHNYELPPVGKGAIAEVEGQAMVEGRFFLDTAAGRDHYTVVKELEDLQEWSYSFYVVEAEPGVFQGQNVRLLKRLDVIGVGPVARGAGIGTRTVAIKQQSTPEPDEGQAGDSAPSGPGPDVFRAQIELIELED